MDLYNASSSGFIQDGESDAPKELTLEELDQAKAEYEAIAEVAQACRRLTENPDVKMGERDRYVQDEPKRLANLMASGKVHETTLKNSARELESIGKFRQFLSFTLEQGNIAEDSLIGLEEARDEFLASRGQPQD